MEGHELLAKLNRVKAPEGFEAGVLSHLAAGRKERERAKKLHFRYALAGTAALVLVGFVLLNPSLFQREEQGGLTLAEREALSATPGKGLGLSAPAAARSYQIPVFETMDYASEFRNASTASIQPRTVYILEQVSDAVSSKVIY